MERIDLFAGSVGVFGELRVEGREDGRTPYRAVGLLGVKKARAAACGRDAVAWRANVAGRLDALGGCVVCR